MDTSPPALTKFSSKLEQRTPSPVSDQSSFPTSSPLQDDQRYSIIGNKRVRMKSPCPADGLTGFKEFLLGTAEEQERHRMKRRTLGRKKKSSTFDIWSKKMSIVEEPRSSLIRNPLRKESMSPQQNFMFAKISNALKAKVIQKMIDPESKKTSQLLPPMNPLERSSSILPNSFSFQSPPASKRSDSASSDDKKKVDSESFLHKLQSMNEKIKIFQQAFQNKLPNYIQHSDLHYERLHRNRQKQLIERKKLNMMDGTYNPKRRISITSGNSNNVPENLDELDELDYELQMINQYRILSKLRRGRKHGRQNRKILLSVPSKKLTKPSLEVSPLMRNNKSNESLSPSEQTPILSKKQIQEKSTEALFHGLNKDLSRHLLEAPTPRHGSDMKPKKSTNNLLKGTRPFMLHSVPSDNMSQRSQISSSRRQAEREHQERVDFMKKIISKDVQLREEALKELKAREKDRSRRSPSGPSGARTSNPTSSIQKYQDVRDKYKNKLKIFTDEGKGGESKQTMSQSFAFESSPVGSRNVNDKIGAQVGISESSQPNSPPVYLRSSKNQDSKRHRSFKFLSPQHTRQPFVPKQSILQQRNGYQGQQSVDLADRPQGILPAHAHRSVKEINTASKEMPPRNQSVSLMGQKILPYIAKEHKSTKRKSNKGSRAARSPMLMVQPRSSLNEDSVVNLESVGDDSVLEVSQFTNIERSPNDSLRESTREEKGKRIFKKKAKVVKLPSISASKAKDQQQQQPASVLRRNKLKHLIELHENYLQGNGKRNSQKIKPESPMKKALDNQQVQSNRISFSSKNRILGCESIQHIDLTTDRDEDHSTGKSPMRILQADDSTQHFPDTLKVLMQDRANAQQQNSALASRNNKSLHKLERTLQAQQMSLSTSSSIQLQRFKISQQLTKLRQLKRKEEKLRERNLSRFSSQL